MCGVFAHAGKERVNVEACLDRLAHRGPDDMGILLSGEVSLGHRRLAIIDLDRRSNQPMESISKHTAIVFNGEIYNYLQLRTELVAQGVSFKTESDTEVILAGYERNGTAFFERMRGMWSFVIHDREKNILIASRDAFGIKPLVYAIVGESIFFSSEIKALKGEMSFEPDPEAYVTFYNLGYFMAPRTQYKGVRKLIPGEVLSWDLNTKELSRVGRISRLAGNPKTVFSYEDSIDLIDRSLTESVEAHYVSDVPVSILLSGGTDSSLIAALSHKLGKRPSAYHVAINGSDDTEYAEAIARELHIPLVIEHLTKDAFAAQYEKIWEILDEPTGDISIIPTSLVYERIKGQAKVVLSGEGGDEFFGGYLRHRLLESHTAVTRENSLNTFLNSFLIPEPLGIAAWNPLVQRVRDLLLYHGTVDDLIGAYLRTTRLAEYPLRDRAIRDALYDLYVQESEPSIAPSLAFDILSYLPGDLLPKSDVASMASSIEARVPFVDRYFAQDAASASKSLRFDNKKILKEVLLRYLPHNLVFRGKTGFSAPIQDQASFLSDFHAACEFHLADSVAFGVDEPMARLIRTSAGRDTLVRKYPRFAFALISSWKCFVI